MGKNLTQSGVAASKAEKERTKIKRDTEVSEKGGDEAD
jgi:hypothetical protein